MLQQIDNDAGSKTRGRRQIYDPLFRGAGSVPGWMLELSEPHLTRAPLRKWLVTCVKRKSDIRVVPLWITHFLRLQVKEMPLQQSRGEDLLDSLMTGK